MGKSKLLIVEDNKIVALDIQAALNRLGYNIVAMVESGEEAILKALELQPDLILMDINLRGDIDGIQAVEIIKKTADIPVIYLSAFTDHKTLERAKLTEPYSYLTKPFNELELDIHISFALHKWKMIKKHEQELKDREERLRSYDHLTGLYNRLYFKEQLKFLDSPDNLPLSVIIGDANGLKLANDAFGHQVGDLLLLKIAKIMKNACDPQHLVARWGGDEFAILLLKTGSQEAKRIITTIRESCAEEKSTPIELSISLGCATKEESSQELEELVKVAEGNMYSQKLQEAGEFRNSIIASLVRNLGQKDYETEEHAWRMQSLAVQFGSRLEINDNDFNDLIMAVTLHDIGKIAVPEVILTKPGPLTMEEREIIKGHSERGYRITLSSQELARIAPIVLSHHERWDGEGYPRGLKGEEIPLLARLISIVDAFDVMTNQRPYKEAISVEQALMEIEKCSGSQFDPRLAQIFISCIKESNY